jgi:VIT1/CCC1 family predicted Fe2+/Mn2+ transporter
MQAVLASPASCGAGAALPIGVVLIATPAQPILWVSIASPVFLAGLGVTSARVGGAPVGEGAWRVTFWGAIAMAVTAGTRALFGNVT